MAVVGEFLSANAPAKKEPAAIPARKVASNSAKPGARLVDARTVMRNHAISKPREINATNADTTVAVLILRMGCATLAVGSGSTDCRTLRRASNSTAPPTRTFMRTAIRTDPDWPKSRRRNVAHK